MQYKLIFDLGNVLFPLDYDELEQWLTTTVEIYDENFKFQFDELYGNYEAGDFDTPEFFSKLKSDLHMVFDEDVFQKKWVSIWKRNFEDMHELIYELQKKHSLILLSNTNQMHMETYLKEQPILKAFDKTYYSYLLGFTKPNPRIYQAVQQDLRLTPSQIIFFDDKPENVEGACKVGWQAFVFKNATGVIEILNNLEIS